MSAIMVGARCAGGGSPFTGKHVLGVAFPYPDAGPSRADALECYFLRLAYALCHLSFSGERACGYFAVLLPEVRDAVRRLQTQYEAIGHVQIVFESLLVSEMTRLAEASELAEREGNPAVLTAVGREIGSDVLRREIAIQEPRVVEMTRAESMPYGVQWDYCGVVHERDQLESAANRLNPRLL